MRASDISNCCDCPLGRVENGQRCPFVERTRRAGEWLYVEGEPAERLWLIKRGAVVLLREAGEHHGEGVAWAVRSAGQVAGLEALVRTSYVDSARAAVPTLACVGSRERVEAWLGEPGPASTLLHLVLAASSGDAPRPNRCDGTALQRVARWLLDESPRRNGAGLPRRVVAELLGMKAETLSRTLAELATRGAIELSRRRLRIRDVDALEHAAS